MNLPTNEKVKDKTTISKSTPLSWVPCCSMSFIAYNDPSVSLNLLASVKARYKLTERVQKLIRIDSPTIARMPQAPPKPKLNSS